jgi:hypothetical protein
MFKAESHNKPSHFGRTITVNSSVLYVLFAGVPFRALPVCHSLSLGHSAFLVASGLPTYHPLPHACVGIFFQRLPLEPIVWIVNLLATSTHQEKNQKATFFQIRFRAKCNPNSSINLVPAIVPQHALCALSFLHPHRGSELHTRSRSELACL